VRVSEARETTSRVEPRRTLRSTNARPSGQAHDAALAASSGSSGSAVQDAPRKGPSATRSAVVAASLTATKATSWSPAIPAHWPGPASSSRTDPDLSPRTSSMSAPSRRSQTTSARAWAPGPASAPGSAAGSAPPDARRRSPRPGSAVLWRCARSGIGCHPSADRRHPRRTGRCRHDHSWRRSRAATTTAAPHPGPQSRRPLGSSTPRARPEGRWPASSCPAGRTAARWRGCSPTSPRSQAGAATSPSGGWHRAA